MKVILTPDDLYWASQVGCARRIESLRRRIKDKAGPFGLANPWQIDIEGACGELAVARFLGVDWEAPVDTFREGGDVGKLQVRTRVNGQRELIVRLHNRASDIYVLVVGYAPEYDVVGWLPGKLCKLPCYLQELQGRPSAYFIPESDLNDPLLLIDEYLAQESRR